MPSHFIQLPKPIAATSNSPILQQTHYDVSTIDSPLITFEQDNPSTSPNLAEHYTTQPQPIPHKDYPDNRANTTQNVSDVTEKQSKFKTLYPAEIEDLTRKEKFRFIDEIGGFKQPNRKKDTYVKAWQEEENAYLFTSQQPAQQVIINCHGSHTGRQDETMEPIRITEETPTIVLMSPHNTNLGMASYLGTTSPYAEVSYQGIKVFSKNAKDDLTEDWMGYSTITGSIHSRAICNYNLSKVTIDPESKLAEAFEVYPEYVAYVVNELAKNQDPADRYDAYTLRKKANTNKISAKELLNYAKKRGYKKVIFYFCRGNATQQNDKLYYPDEKNEQLEKPVFKSWEEIQKMAEEEE